MKIVEIKLNINLIIFIKLFFDILILFALLSFSTPILFVYYVFVLITFFYIWVSLT